MTITRILYFLVSYNVLWSVIQANQPGGHLGCFQDLDGESLVEPRQGLGFDFTNKGEMCKIRCKNTRKRYAGTKYVWCYCGSGVVQNRITNSTECGLNCPGNANERCGGYHFPKFDRISLYDTWLCITSPCQNGGTCTDINAESYMCACSVGWTGRFCNETITTTTTTTSPTTSTQAIGNLTVAAQPSENKLAIYIAVPVSIFVIIVFVLIVTVLIVRRKLNRKKDSKMTLYQNSANTSHSLFTVLNNAYNDQDIIPLENRVNGNATKDKEADAAMGEREHSYYSLEQTGDGNRNYNIAGQRSGSAIQNDDNGYGHLHVRSTAFCDPTYSHTITTGPQGTTDNTYSHLDQSVGNENHEIMSNVDQDTYNTCNMKGDVRKTRLAVEINVVDDTYNRLAISGKAEKKGEKHTVSSVNEPDYDHTDARNTIDGLPQYWSNS